MMSLPSASGALFSSVIVSLHTMQFKRPISGLLSSFNDILGARTGSLPLRLQPEPDRSNPIGRRQTQRLAKMGDRALSEIREAQQCFVRCLAHFIDGLEA